MNKYRNLWREKKMFKTGVSKWSWTTLYTRCWILAHKNQPANPAKTYTNQLKIFKQSFQTFNLKTPALNSNAFFFTKD